MAATRREDERADATAFDDFFENIGVALHIVGADGRILHANRAELELLGYSRAEYVGRDIAHFHADPETIGEILGRLRGGGSVRAFPARLIARDGSIRHVEITSGPSFRNGVFAGTRCATIDVTEVKAARDELARKERMYRQVLDALPAAVYMTDADGRISYFNQAAVGLAGREPRLGIDQWCVTYRLRTPEGIELPLDQCPMAVALQENRPVRGVEAMALRPDGTLVPFLPFPTPLRDEDGTLTGAVNMLVDISERKQSEANQQVLLNELNHRVKNNIQMLHGLLQAAHRDAKSAEARTVLHDVGRRVAAMAAAQRLLYDHSNPRSLSIMEFLHAICTAARQSFDGDIAVRLIGDRGHLSSDVSMPLALILNELLTNAAKHGKRDDRPETISVSLTRSEHGFVLRVTDEGPGLEQRDVTRRTSGLDLVHGLARQIGGTFAIEPGAGAQCVVRFPDLNSLT